MRIIACGNCERMDDGVGLLIAERLHALGIEAILQSGEPMELISAWEGEDDVIVIDAILTGSPPGTMHIWNCQDALPPSDPSASTHGVGLAEAIELARTLGRIPRNLRVYGIEGKQFGLGAGISTELQPAMEQVIRKIVKQAVGKT